MWSVGVSSVSSVSSVSGVSGVSGVSSARHAPELSAGPSLLQILLPCHMGLGLWLPGGSCVELCVGCVKPVGWWLVWDRLHPRASS